MSGELTINREGEGLSYDINKVKHQLCINRK